LRLPLSRDNETNNTAQRNRRGLPLRASASARATTIIECVSITRDFLCLSRLDGKVITPSRLRADPGPAGEAQRRRFDSIRRSCRAERISKSPRRSRFTGTRHARSLGGSFEFSRKGCAPRAFQSPGTPRRNMLDRKGEGERDRGAEGVRLHVRGWWFKSERPVSRARPKREQLIVMCGGRRGILIFPLNASPGGRSLSLSPPLRPRGLTKTKAKGARASPVLAGDLWTVIHLSLPFTLRPALWARCGLQTPALARNCQPEAHKGGSHLNTSPRADAIISRCSLGGSRKRSCDCNPRRSRG